MFSDHISVWLLSLSITSLCVRFDLLSCPRPRNIGLAKHKQTARICSLKNISV